MNESHVCYIIIIIYFFIIFLRLDFLIKKILDISDQLDNLQAQFNEEFNTDHQDKDEEFDLERDW